VSIPGGYRRLDAGLEGAHAHDPVPGANAGDVDNPLVEIACGNRRPEQRLDGYGWGAADGSYYGSRLAFLKG
jgi:hypothetical protein